MWCCRDRVKFVHSVQSNLLGADLLPVNSSNVQHSGILNHGRVISKKNDVVIAYSPPNGVNMTLSSTNSVLGGVFSLSRPIGIIVALNLSKKEEFPKKHYASLRYLLGLSNSSIGSSLQHLISTIPTFPWSINISSSSALQVYSSHSCSRKTIESTS